MQVIYTPKFKHGGFVLSLVITEYGTDRDFYVHLRYPCAWPEKKFFWELILRMNDTSPQQVYKSTTSLQVHNNCSTAKIGMPISIFDRETRGQNGRAKKYPRH